MNAIVNNFEPVNPVLLFQIRIKARLDVLDNGLPAGDEN
jgi:hypothetical protein